jgi:hypothetical protein
MTSIDVQFASEADAFLSVYTAEVSMPSAKAKHNLTAGTKYQ